MLGQALAMYDDIAGHLRECDAKLGALLAERSAANVDLGKTPRQGSKACAEFDVRQQLANWAGADLTRINGLGLDSVMKILCEIGTDLSRFAKVKHFCSWLGLCPATKISGGKVLSARTKCSANRVRQALKMATMSLSHSDSALGAFYRRLCSRMDKPRANTATAHKLARMVYFMLTRGEAFVCAAGTNLLFFSRSERACSFPSVFFRSMSLTRLLQTSPSGVDEADWLVA